MWYNIGMGKKGESGGGVRRKYVPRAPAELVEAEKGRMPQLVSDRELATQLEAIATSNPMDIFEVGEDGTLRRRAMVGRTAMAAVKSIKFAKDGVTVQSMEFHPKLPALRLLAEIHGKLNRRPRQEQVPQVEIKLQLPPAEVEAEAFGDSEDDVV